MSISFSASEVICITRVCQACYTQETKPFWPQVLYVQEKYDEWVTYYLGHHESRSLSGLRLRTKAVKDAIRQLRSVAPQITL